VTISPASSEEQAFANEVNKLLGPDGGKVQPYTSERNDKTTYCLLFWLGAKRTTITSETPFHYETPQSVSERVKEWVERSRQSNRWSTDLADADRSPDL